MTKPTPRYRLIISKLDPVTERWTEEAHSEHRYRGDAESTGERLELLYPAWIRGSRVERIEKESAA